MFAIKNLKKNDMSKQPVKSESIQRKAIGKNIIQNAVMASNNCLSEDAAQFKKIMGNSSLVGFLNTKPLQREVIPEEEEEPIQMKIENKTGMPDNLRAGIESLSGIDMSDVRVHYNSNKPAGVGALAYTQGTDIHVATGQEKHLAHEAWHVVQQAQGRVQPTTQLKDVAVNDDPGLEHEADIMGERALNI